MNVEEVGSDLLLPTEGHVTVDLCDPDTGRVLERQEAPNFQSLQTIKVLKWWQRMVWGAYIPTVTNDAQGNPPDEMPWDPTQHIGYWNDATAEDSATEDVIRGELVGWASRHPVGSPTGKRGVVNIGESVMTDTSVKWVFDWNTSQGNGTFQSIGWTRVFEPVDRFLVPRFPEADRISFTPGGGGGNTCPGIWWDSTASLWYLADWNGTSYVLKTAPATGGALTTVLTLPNWTSSSPNYGLARIGTDIITCGFNNGQIKPWLIRNTSAGAAVWNRVETTLASSTTYADCTVDGSGNIWTMGSDGIVRKHSNADGTITATPTLPYTFQSGVSAGGAGIAFDPADGNLWVMGQATSSQTKLIYKMDTSGNAVGPFWSLHHAASSPPLASTSPWAGQYTIPAAGSREPYQFKRWVQQTAALVGSDVSKPSTIGAGTVLGASSSQGNGHLVVKGGELWACGQNPAGGIGCINQASPVRGGTLGTRSRLASPVTKTSASALKITYQFNFA